MRDVLAEALRRERLRRNLKQRDVAHHFGVSQPTYHRWESGENLPGDAHRHEVAEFLGVSVQDVWEMIHNEAPPVSLTLLQAQLSAAQRDIEELRARVAALEGLANDGPVTQS